MGILDSKQWISDIDEIISSLPELSELAGKTVMITGVTGLICSSVADVFIRYNATHEKPIKILAAGRKSEKVESRFAPYCKKDYFKFVSYDASRNDNVFHFPCDYIIHGAGNASPVAVMREPVETMLSNFTGMLYLLSYAKEYNV